MKLRVCPLLLAVFLNAAAPGQEIVTTTTGVYALDWKTTDIQLKLGTGASASTISFKSISRAEWDKTAKDADEGQSLSGETTFRVLSAMGPYLSVEMSDYCECGGAHPSALKLFDAYDIRGSAARRLKPASLDQIFPKESILAALKADKLVAGAIRELKIPSSAGLAELLDKLKFEPIMAGDCAYSFGQTPMNNFAFYDVIGDRVAVRISLSHAYEVCRGQMTQIGILLPIPESLKADLAAAKANTGGFLMIDSLKLAKGKETSFTFETKAKAVK